MGKLLVGMHTFDEYRIVMDFAGGLGWAMPTYADCEHLTLRGILASILRVELIYLQRIELRCLGS
jgi:hypothetical protein